MRDGKNIGNWEEFLAKTNLPEWDSGPVVVADQNIVPYFQPIISVTSGRIAGYECLARSLNTSGGARSFGHFFNNPKIQSGFQLEVDRSLRYQALQYFAEHEDAGYITLNISPLWIESSVEYQAIPTLQMIEATGIDPARVVIEITESKGDIPRLKKMVDVYHDAGLMVAIDDFGAGASQIDRVEALKPDIVKLDMRMFKKASRGGESADVALSIASIANRLGCFLVCEGVETEEEFHFGIECGSNHIQGFLFHEAMPETIRAESTIEKVRRLQRSYLKEKSIRLTNATEQKQLIKNIVMEIKQNYLDGKPLEKTGPMNDSNIFRYYITDEVGNQLTPNYERDTTGFYEDLEWIGMNWSHRPYFPSFLVLNKLAGKNFVASEVYRDVKTRHLCRTYATYLNESRILLVDALVEDEILFVKE
tara:strand:- start:190456 stop:191718 length:1263 start_codon:yes stop_codon:yes gene_type:complete